MKSDEEIRRAASMLIRVIDEEGGSELLAAFFGPLLWMLDCEISGRGAFSDLIDRLEACFAVETGRHRSHAFTGGNHRQARQIRSSEEGRKSMTDNNCPRCHKLGIPSGDRAFWCRRCKIMYEPDCEGIDPTIAYNPERRMLREEDRKPKQQRRR